MSSVLEQVEALTDRVYGKGSAVSVDKEHPGWVVRCWDKTGKERDSSGPPIGKHNALAVMKRRLERSSFLRLDASDVGHAEAARG